MLHTMSPRDLVIPLLIDGKEDNASGTFDVVSAKTGKACWKAATASTEDAIRAVKAAENAFPSWSKTKPAEKQRILFRAAELLESRISEYGEIMQMEMGGDKRPVQGWVLPNSVSYLRDIASHIPVMTGSALTSGDEGTSAMIWKEPNAPYALGMGAAATAIATGNTTVLKGSELSPRCYWALGQVFQEAGLPSGVLNIIYCKSSDSEEVVSTMIKHPAVRKVNFTGSTDVGRKVARTCGEFLKPCLMELGEKNSAIVLADADLQKAARECIVGAVLHSGQICMSTDRIIIHTDIAEEFLQIFKSTLVALVSSAPDSPYLVTAASKSRLQELVSAALADGASSLLDNDQSSPVIFTPMIIGDIQEDMKLWRHEEAFGPVAAYAIAQNDDEAVKMANDTEHGLSAAVFTQDLRKGFAIAKRLQSGLVSSFYPKSLSHTKIWSKL
ncbi:aldehyde dehydrogenase family protein [Rutstroemia sp. NJR-2017a BVV2]|nr:aldehyde dehydrogenase family protein [Rutstroemia sp. NJR-2017a BVV2]